MVKDWLKRHILPDFWRVEKPLARCPRWIMVVSPEPAVGRLAQVNLERQGYEVSLIRFAEDALVDLLDNENPPGILILDSAVPDVEFEAVLRELKSDPDTRQIPLVALLGSKQDTDTFRRWASGRDSFLTKPFNPMELIAFVRRTFHDLEEADSGHLIIDIM